MKMKLIAKAAAAIGYKAAVKASGTASAFGCYQPKEPKALQNLKK